MKQHGFRVIIFGITCLQDRLLKNELDTTLFNEIVDLLHNIYDVIDLVDGPHIAKLVPFSSIGSKSPSRWYT